MRNLILPFFLWVQLSQASERLPINWWIPFTNAVDAILVVKTNDVVVSSVTNGVPFQQVETFFWVDLPKTNVIYTLHLTLILFKDMTQLYNPDIYPSEYPNPDYHTVTNLPMRYFRFTRKYLHADTFICYSGSFANTTNTNGVPFWNFGRMPCRFHRNDPDGIAPPRSTIHPAPLPVADFQVVEVDPLDRILKLIPD